MKTNAIYTAIAVGLLGAVIAPPTVFAGVDAAKATPSATDQAKPDVKNKDQQKGDAKTGENVKGEKPEASPGWIVVEEDFWYPLRFEPLDWFHNAEAHYRLKETKAAAAELRKAESWLKFAESHAMPNTKAALDDAMADIKVLADDLESGKVAAASDMEKTVGKASQALAEWHYFHADKMLAQSDENIAATHLAAAARYLKRAASSAQYEDGDEFVTVYDDMIGWDLTEIDSNVLKKNFDVVGAEITRVHDALKKAADKK